VLLSFALYFLVSSRFVKLNRRQLLSDGRFELIAMPEELENEGVHVFAVDGSLHFAGARMLERQWPKIGPHTRRPVIIMELHGRNNIGATLTEVLWTIYDKIEKAGGRFYITELGERSYNTLRTQTALETLKEVRILKQEAIIGSSTEQAVIEARAWLKSN
jgi:SulP family sulfate permease